MEYIVSEEWKPVVGYEGIYDVSDHGRVRSLLRRKGWKPGIMKHFIGTPGYPVVHLSNGSCKPFSIHRLVAASFLGPCPAGFDVNHKNGIKTDNRPENLEYLSRSDNQKHAVAIGIAGCGRKISDEDASVILELRKSGKSQSAIAKMFGVSRPLISLIGRGKVQYANRMLQHG